MLFLTLSIFFIVMINLVQHPFKNQSDPAIGGTPLREIPSTKSEAPNKHQIINLKF